TFVFFCGHSIPFWIEGIFAPTHLAPGANVGICRQLIVEKIQCEKLAEPRHGSVARKRHHGGGDMKRIHWWTLFGASGAALTATLVAQSVWGQPGSLPPPSTPVVQPKSSLPPNGDGPPSTLPKVEMPVLPSMPNYPSAGPGPSTSTPSAPSLP